MLVLRLSIPTDPPPVASVDLRGPTLARWADALAERAPQDPEPRQSREEQ